ncbi:MAG: SDR family NAD(P)-dependent oxidoreductase [Acidimicrobiia bacterium]|nr:SDR family NAD(P)-dependent oxidoreductase [Acidimicrobiia bacterium]
MAAPVGVPRGSVAVITGAGSGMGQLSAQRLAAAGTEVVAVDVNDAGLATTARLAPTIRTELCDVSDGAAVADLVRRVESDVGPIHRLVNAAAIAPTALLADQPLEEMRRLVEVNFLGLMATTTAVLDNMLARRRGEIVQYGSLAGWLPTPYFGTYSATKAAVVSWSETLHHEMAGLGIKVVCVCPPVVETPLLDQAVERPARFDQLPRLGPEEVLDSVEDALAAGRCFAFPGRGTTATWRMRRWAPALMWRNLRAFAGDLTPRRARDPVEQQVS